mgnify:CR=1 FL=1
MALFSECSRKCAQILLDTADIVREARCFAKMRSFVYLCNTLWQGQIAMNGLFATVVGFALVLKPCEGASHFHEVRFL